MNRHTILMKTFRQMDFLCRKTKHVQKVYENEKYPKEISGNLLLMNIVTYVFNDIMH